MPTISDVARRAQVSAATVSRVIQGAANVHPDTRQRVERAIAELGYVPSAVAQSLRSRRSHSLALVVPDITNPFWTTVARGVEDVAQEHDYSVFLGNTDEDPAKQLRYLDFLVSQQVDGVLIAPHDSDAGHLARLRQRNIPTVAIDRQIDGWDVDCVYADSLSGARALIQHLIGLGHRHIAMITGPTTTSTARDREAGYCMALAEAGIAVDPRLIRHGEYRNTSGHELTLQLLDEGLAPSALFAANNALAIGAIDALKQRGLRIPQDVALVSFDDLPNLSHVFPFLTVVAQPVYELGVNAAQLLLSRLESKGNLQPRQVVLPTRLIVRHSCGSKLQPNGQCALSLPIPNGDLGNNIMVKQISAQERRELQMVVGMVDAGSAYESPDVARLLRVLQHQEADRLPHLELDVTGTAILEYVLERPLGYELGGSRSISPEDHIEFALRLGMDAVPCDLTWRPVGSVAGGIDLEPPPRLIDQLNLLERYLRLAQGTRVGIMARFSSFFQAAWALAGTAGLPRLLQDNRRLGESLLDRILEHQERIMQVVCDRFAGDLALIIVDDRLADKEGLLLPEGLLHEIHDLRMRRLVLPALEHGKLLMVHSPGRIDAALPLLHGIGFNAVHPIEPGCNDIVDLKRKWAGRLALVGNVPVSLLAGGQREEIERLVQSYCATLAPGGGYVLSSAGTIDSSVPPANLVAMIRAAHQYGRYGGIGQDLQAAA